MNPDQWRTYLVTQQSLSAGRSTETIVAAAIEGGVDAVQLREKDTSAQHRIELGERLRERTGAADIDLIVNDRIDIAYAVGADGVHLGQSDPSVSTAREILGPEATIGVSVSTVSEARLAAISGADYLGVGAIYGTDSKPDAETADDGLGVDQLAKVADAVTLPIIAIGGVTAENAGGPVQAGASGVAAIGAITAADDPTAATRELCKTVDAAAENERGATDG